MAICGEGRLVYCNPEFSRLLDYSPGEHLEGRQVSELLADSDRQLVMQRHQALAAGRRIPAGWIRFKTSGGEPVQMMLNESSMLWNGKPHVVIAATLAPQELLDRQLREARAHHERELVTELEKQQAAIARDLHDCIGSELAGMSLMLGAIQAMRPDDAALPHKLQALQGQLQASIATTRGLARGLVPVDAHGGAFWRALERLASDLTLLKGVPCEFMLDGELEVFEQVDADTGTHLYRIVQEAVANALGHGRARHIRLRLTQRAPELVLEIEDDGAGFSAGGETGSSTGLGMRFMRARAQAIRGRIELLAVRPAGTCIRVSWPGAPGVHPPPA